MTTSAHELREEVRRRYAESARAAIEGSAGCGCGSGSCCEGDDATKFGEALYDAEQRGELPDTAALASLGCGNPTAVADLAPGETVLDLGSGGGIDVILSAKRVGPTGRAYGLDMTDEMLALARRNATEAGVENAIFLKGMIEQVPLPAESRRRRDLELRDQPLDGQGGRADRDRACAQARRPRRGLRRRRRGSPHSGERAERGSLRRLHRRSALEERVRGRARGGRLRGRQGQLHPRSRRRDARRDRQGDEAGEPRRRAPVIEPATARAAAVAERALARSLVAELIGTFALVFAGAGAIMVDAKTRQLGHVGVAITFGLVIMAMIYAVGHVSGAHLNPAVSFAFALTRHFPWSRVAGYWAAQLAGASRRRPWSCVRRSGTIAHVGATLPSGSQGQAFLWELILTLLPDVRDHGRRHRHPRRRGGGRDRDRRHGRTRRDVRRSDHRRIHEPGPLDRAGARLRRSARALALHRRARSRAPPSARWPTSSCAVNRTR